MKIFKPLLALASFFFAQKVQTAFTPFGTIPNSGELNNFLLESMNKANQGNLRLSRVTKAFMKAMVHEITNSVNIYDSIGIMIYFVYTEINSRPDRSSLNWENVIDASFAKFQGMYPDRAARAIAKIISPLYPILKNRQLDSFRGPSFEKKLDSYAVAEFRSYLEFLTNNQYSHFAEQTFQELIIEASRSTIGYIDLKYHSIFLRKLQLKNLVRSAIPQNDQNCPNLAHYLYKLANEQFNVVDRQVTDKILISISSLAYDKIKDSNNYQEFIKKCLDLEKDSEEEHHVECTIRQLESKLQELNGSTGAANENLKRIIIFLFGICETPLLKGLINLNGLYFEFYNSQFDEGCFRSFAYIIMCMFTELYPIEARNYHQSIGVEFSMAYFLYNQQIYDTDFLRKVLRFGHVRTFMDITENQMTVPGELINVVYITSSVAAAIIFRTKSQEPISIDAAFKKCIMESASYNEFRIAKFLMNLVPREDLDLQALTKSSLIEAIGEESAEFVYMIFNEGFYFEEDFVPIILTTILENLSSNLARPFFRRFPGLPDSTLDVIFGDQDDFDMSIAMDIAIEKPDLSDEWLRKAIEAINDQDAIEVIRRARPHLFAPQTSI